MFMVVLSGRFLNGDEIVVVFDFCLCLVCFG